MSIDQAKKMLDVGASAIVCPGFEDKLVEFCLLEKIPILPGCVTASEIQKAYGYGLKEVKYFPGLTPGCVEIIKIVCRSVPSSEIRGDWRYKFSQSAGLHCL